MAEQRERQKLSSSEKKKPKVIISEVQSEASNAGSIFERIGGMFGQKEQSPPQDDPDGESSSFFGNFLRGFIPG